MLFALKAEKKRKRIRWTPKVNIKNIIRSHDSAIVIRVKSYLTWNLGSYHVDRQVSPRRQERAHATLHPGISSASWEVDAALHFVNLQVQCPKNWKSVFGCSLLVSACNELHYQILRSNRTWRLLGRSRNLLKWIAAFKKLLLGIPFIHSSLSIMPARSNEAPL